MPSTPLAAVHFSPDIDAQKVTVRAKLLEAAPQAAPLRLRFKTGSPSSPELTETVPEGAKELEFDVAIPNAHLWSLDDPFLYEVDVLLGGRDQPMDKVATYFGMRKISVQRLPGQLVLHHGDQVHGYRPNEAAYHTVSYLTGNRWAHGRFPFIIVTCLT